MSAAAGIAAGVERLRADGAGEAVVAAFAGAAEQLAAGETGVLREADIEPVRELPDAAQLPDPGPQVAELLDATVVIKLNGGLGTSMGMTRAKSLLEVKDGRSFLDIAATQIERLRASTGTPRIPLVLNILPQSTM